MFPLAPSSPSFLVKLRLAALGFRDRKKYSQSLDSTSTHAIIHIQSIAQAGQHEVNREYLEQATAQLSANAVTQERIDALKNQVEETKLLLKSLDGRRRDLELRNLQLLQKSLGELKNQLAANQKRFEAIHVQAQQALDSWSTYFNLLASNYVRQRLRIKKNSAPAPADIPSFNPIRLSELVEHQKNSGGKRASAN